MKIVQILNNKVHWITPWTTFEEVPPFAPDIKLVEAPEEVQEGWIYQDGNFTDQEVISPNKTVDIPIIVDKPKDIPLETPVFDVLKNIIIKGTVDVATNLKTLNIFLETGKITTEQYQELVLLL